MSFNNVAIVYLKVIAYRIHFWFMSKDDAINIWFYENDKERLREQARDKYRNLSEEEKNKKREYGKNRYCNMSKEKKQILKKYQKIYREAEKSQCNNE